jgi:hypothetical protein
MATWYDTTLCTSTDLQARESLITSYGLSSTQLTTRISKAKDYIGNELRTRLKRYYLTINLKTDELSDLVTAASTTVTSAGSTFVTDGIDVGDEFIVSSGTDQGRYLVASITSETQLVLTTALTTSATGIHFYILKDLLDLILNKEKLLDLCVYLSLANIYQELRKSEEDMMHQKHEYYNRLYIDEFNRAMNFINLDLDEDKIPDPSERAAGFSQSFIKR